MAGLPPRSSWDDDGRDGQGNSSGAGAGIVPGTAAVPTTAAELGAPVATTPHQPSPARWSPTVRPGHRLRRGIDPATWPVGFSPTGEALPETLTDVLLRGSHAIRSSKRAEAVRLERAAAIADHVEAQIREFLAFCAAEDLVPPVTVRANGQRPDRAQPHGGGPRTLGQASAPLAHEHEHEGEDEDGHVHEGGTAADETDPRRARVAAPQPGRRLRRERLNAWPLLYWRCENFPAPGRSLHLFVEPGGRTFEGRDDPAPLTVLGREVKVWPVDAPTIVASMAEVDARRCALHLVHGMAHMLWQAGVGL